MNYATIKYCDIADGEGVRTTLFVSGCTHCCKGCFQPETWNFAYGEAFDDTVAETLIESLAPAYISGFTVLGGEPMEPENQPEIARLLTRIKEAWPTKTIWVYTGDVFEDLIDPVNPRHTAYTNTILETIDVLVDGPFIEERKNISLRFCGSDNQRVINVPATLAQGSIVLWEDDPLFRTHTM